MIMNNMRGGICSISLRYAEANNKYMKEQYNAKKESSYLTYLDANNLYGKSMTSPLPTGNYLWNNDILLKDILDTPEDSETGYILECDIEIDNDLHDKFSDSPLCVEKTSFKDLHIWQN